MRIFDLKHGWLVPHPYNDDPSPGRTIYPEPLHLAGQAQPNYSPGEYVVRREDEVDADELDHAREWLWHLQNGRIGAGKD